ncbi:MAG TPA: outer membrane beta-barrel protein [Acidobacteriaceae bacterium]|jgi:opacity protein-like surface antigen|nr:outer membrane beta-barrel protein [Acidobacteriaceae bacterium]
MKVRSIQAIFLVLITAIAATASAQTSVAASIYGAFSGTTTGNGTRQSPANQAGGIFELRHIANPILGFEATYSFNRADETYKSAPTGCPAFGCTVSVETVRANAHELTADWTPSVHIANLRPFGVLGVGLLLDVPSGSQATVVTTNPTPGQSPVNTTITTTSNTSTSTKPVYVYGAGLDWGLLPHLGLRFQYRGNLYKAPDLSSLYTSTNAFTHTAEPMIGLYFNL